MPGQRRSSKAAARPGACGVGPDGRPAQPCGQDRLHLTRLEMLDQPKRKVALRGAHGDAQDVAADHVGLARRARPAAAAGAIRPATARAGAVRATSARTVWSARARAGSRQRCHHLSSVDCSTPPQNACNSQLISPVLQRMLNVSSFPQMNACPRKPVASGEFQRKAKIGPLRAVWATSRPGRGWKLVARGE